MGWKILFAVACLLPVSPLGALAQSGPARLDVSAESNFGYNSNFGTTRNNPVSGLNATPVLGFALSQNLSKNWSYSIEGGNIFDRYDRDIFSGELTKLSFTTSYRIRDWSYAINYTPSWAFSPHFEVLQARVDDFKFSITSPFADLGHIGSVNFQVAYRERVGVIGALSSHSPAATVNWRKQLPEKWVATGRFLARYVALEGGGNPEDLVLTKTLGVQRDMSDYVSLGFTAGHENRFSSVAAREYDQWTFLSTVSLSMNIFGAR